MAPNDADMPDHYALKEDLDEIAKHLAALRHNVDTLTGSIGRTGSHQAERLQEAANEAVNAIEASVRRDPVTALGIAAGVGLLLGILLRR
jgi:ElaB/YqjD/DUF883 family membrane-anchored ribosome-binding protein